MIKKIKLTRPIQFYFGLFLSLGVALLLFMTWSFYHEAKRIQHSVKEQASQAAKQELAVAIQNTLDITQLELKLISEWDEIHQQLQDPSYYFFWHDERLKRSNFFKKHYESLELYREDKHLLTKSRQKKHPVFPTIKLPVAIIDSRTKVTITDEKSAYLTIYQPITKRDTGQILGYVGVLLDLRSALLNQNQFHYLDKSSLAFTGNKSVTIQELIPAILFQPISNPIDPHLWDLMQQFIIQMVLILGLVSLALLLLFNKFIRSPIVRLSSYLQRLQSAPKQTHLPPSEQFFIKEYEDFKHAIHQYHSELQLAHNELDQQNEMVWEQARRDALTNVYNRRAFDEAWTETIKTYKERPRPTAFVLFDCDFFKALNDTYGHEVGDEVIRLSANTIQQSLPMEHPPYRIGGDEFAVIIQNRSMPEIYRICQHTLEELQAISFSRLGVKEKLVFSVGISAIAMTKEDCITRLPRQADIAMYKAKQSHRTKIQAYNQLLEDQSSILVSNYVINTVVNSIHTGENIEMHYQPVISIDGTCSYYESLIRIRGNEGLIYPNEIFSLVDRRRLEVELDKQVIKSTLKTIQSGELPDNTGLSINISGKTLTQPDFIDLFSPFVNWLGKYNIIIEITENILIDHMEYAQKVLNTLRDKGFLIALDDFGSGYSSIRYLATMPVDIIKFDITMTQALSSDDKTKQIILTTAEMVRTAGFDLVMEGIETQEMYQQARTAGATHLQGYLLGKPNAEILPPTPLKLSQ